ncbi:MAG: hypothetical protein IKS31_01465 [Clostridia bacterium]|nr:hypothetical protein [Clostridia bacterium]
MEEQKILFADVYRLLGSIRAELKMIDKAAQELLYEQPDWEHVSMIVNGISADAELARKMSECIRLHVTNFLENGPYAGESAGITPLEAMAR